MAVHMLFTLVRGTKIAGVELEPLAGKKNALSSTFAPMGALSALFFFSFF